MRIDSSEQNPVWDYHLRSDKKARLYEVSVFLFLVDFVSIVVAPVLGLK